MPDQRQNSNPGGNGPSAHNQLRWRNELVRGMHPELDALDSSSLPYPGPGATAAEDADVDTPTTDKIAHVAGKGMKVAGTGVQAAGRGAQAAGAGVDIAGKGVDAAGKGVGAAGKGMMQAGTALSGTGLGAIVGVPLAIAGGAAVGAGAGMQAGGKGMQATGKGMRKAGASAVKGGKQLGAMAGKGGGLGKSLPMGKMKGGGLVSGLAELKVSGDIASQVLQNAKLRWIPIKKLLISGNVWTLLIFALLAPVITGGWILFSIFMSFRVSGKEWILLGVSNAAFAFIVLGLFTIIVILACVTDISCILAAGETLLQEMNLIESASLLL